MEMVVTGLFIVSVLLFFSGLSLSVKLRAKEIPISARKNWKQVSDFRTPEMEAFVYVVTGILFIEFSIFLVNRMTETGYEFNYLHSITFLLVGLMSFLAYKFWNDFKNFIQKIHIRKETRVFGIAISMLI